MDFNDTPEEAAFRTEVRAFITAEAPKPKKGESAQEALVSGWSANQEWFKKLGQKGWIAPAWPKEYGGASMTTVQQFIFNEEMANANAPIGYSSIGVGSSHASHSASVMPTSRTSPA